VYGSKWILWRQFCPKTALILWAATSALSLGLFVVCLSRTIKYVERPESGMQPLSLPNNQPEQPSHNPVDLRQR
jgi:hypothetical protein